MKTLWKPLNMHANGVAYVAEHLRANRTVCHLKTCEAWPPYPGSPDGFEASLNSVNVDQLILCHFREAPYCRKVSYKNNRNTWRDFFELCVGHDFYSGKRLASDDLAVQRSRLKMDECPYKTARPLDF